MENLKILKVDNFEVSEKFNIVEPRIVESVKNSIIDKFFGKSTTTDSNIVLNTTEPITKLGKYWNKTINSDNSTLAPIVVYYENGIKQNRQLDINIVANGRIGGYFNPTRGNVSKKFIQQILFNSKFKQLSRSSEGLSNDEPIFGNLVFVLQKILKTNIKVHFNIEQQILIEIGNVWQKLDELDIQYNGLIYLCLDLFWRISVLNPIFKQSFGNCYGIVAIKGFGQHQTLKQILSNLLPNVQFFIC
jgi:hypothetical protein